MSSKRRKCRAMVFTVVMFFMLLGISKTQDKPASKTQIVLLGTGVPRPDPERSGPATAIVVNGTAYIVDFGTGVVRQAAADRKKGVVALEPVNLKIGFLTHLHSDHTLGFADIIFTPWVMGRRDPTRLRFMGHRERATWRSTS
jgi:ribonuclease BN (tRNA processing enzyme)